MEKYYITTPIYYPSGKFHIGTAYTTVVADTVKKYKNLRGYDTYLLTGLDEHGQKIQTVAEKNHMTPQEHVDHMADMAKELWAKMEIEYDDLFVPQRIDMEKWYKKFLRNFLLMEIFIKEVMRECIVFLVRRILRKHSW